LKAAFSTGKGTDGSMKHLCSPSSTSIPVT
jgi:hypothetical protein